MPRQPRSSSKGLSARSKLAADFARLRRSTPEQTSSKLLVTPSGPRGFDLDPSGDLRPLLLDDLSGVAASEALTAYVRRAHHGSTDEALVLGTGRISRGDGAACPR